MFCSVSLRLAVKFYSLNDCFYELLARYITPPHLTLLNN